MITVKVTEQISPHSRFSRGDWKFTTSRDDGFMTSCGDTRINAATSIAFALLWFDLFNCTERRHSRKPDGEPCSDRHMSMGRCSGGAYTGAMYGYWPI